MAKWHQPSRQTLLVLSALCASPLSWRHGYDIAKETGLKSGTMYPILIRLADRGLLEARWEDEQPAGRPRRHLYRLTEEGLAAAGPAVALDRRSRKPTGRRWSSGRVAGAGA